MNETAPFASIPSQQSPLCSVDADCLNGGACSLPTTLNATCQCFRGYWGSLCEKGLYDLQAPLFIVHQVVMVAVFLTLTVVAGLNLAAAIILTKRAAGKPVDQMVAVLFSFVLFGCFGASLWAHQ